jgi:hypothetical protein
VNEYQIGKDMGILMARLEALEKKVGCGCGGHSAASTTVEVEYFGKQAEVTKESATGHMEKDISATKANCTGNGHLRSTSVPPTGYPSGPRYCQICCIGNGDDGWYYCYNTVNGQRVYVTRENGTSASVSCGGSTLICSC